MQDQNFSQSILSWYEQHKREMPWRGEQDPYKIWVSEIMLQQTRVDQVMPYFDRFISLFPTVYDLAGADQQTVLKAWEGLGYYSRARNLHAAAKDIVQNYNGVLPDEYDEIIKLKGIGPYTAAAITSIAFNRPQAVVDGNVIRVLSRYAGITDDVRKGGTVKVIQELANSLIDKEQPGNFNQALMELGSTVCTPSKPECLQCPIRSGCVASKTAQTQSLPYKSKAKKKPHHIIGVGIIEDMDGRVLIAQRKENVMLGGMWEFPGGKQNINESIEQTIERELKEELNVQVIIRQKLMSLKHVYSHFSITLHAYYCSILSGSPEPRESQQIQWVHKHDLSKYPFPKANKVLTEKLILG